MGLVPPRSLYIKNPWFHEIKFRYSPEHLRLEYSREALLCSNWFHQQLLGSCYLQEVHLSTEPVKVKNLLNAICTTKENKGLSN